MQVPWPFFRKMERRKVVLQFFMGNYDELIIWSTLGRRQTYLKKPFKQRPLSQTKNVEMYIGQEFLAVFLLLLLQVRVSVNLGIVSYSLCGGLFGSLS